MKYVQSAVVIAALLNNSKAVSLKSNGQHISKAEQMAAEHALLEMTYNQRKSETAAKAMNLTDEQLLEKVNQTVALAKQEAAIKEKIAMAEPPKPPAAPTPPDAEKTKEAVAKDAEMKAIEEVLSRRILDRLTYDYGYPYANPHYYPINPELAWKIGSLRAYHDYLLGWELENAIAGLVAPSIEEVAKVLQAATNTSGMKNAEEQKKAVAAAPAAAGFVQLESEGVPVLVQPTLMENDAAHEDLKQRNIMMDGVNGYDFVQTKAEGIPVLVNPESMLKTDTITEVGLGQMTIGIEDVNLVGTDSAKPTDDSNVVLQVNGVPVLVNPESMIKTDTTTSVGISSMQVGLEDLTFMQREKQPADDSNVVLQVNGVPVLVNPESMIKTDTTTSVGISSMQVGLEDLTFPQIPNDENVVLQVNGVPVTVPESNQNLELNQQVVLQVHGVPVYVNPESMLRTDTFTTGVGLGKMEVGIDELKNLNVGLNNEVVMQVHGKPVKIQDNTLLMNPVENPPFNNWSVNQPNVPHLHGMEGTEDLGARDIIIDGVNYDYVQTSNPVENPPFNNWSVNQPGVPHLHGMEGTEDLGARDIIIDGMNYDYLQTSNPVENPPFNNWSVNQPSVPHLHGMEGTEDLGARDIIIDGMNFDYLQTSNPVENPPFNNWSVNQPAVPHLHGMEGTEDLGARDIIVDGVNFDYVQLGKKDDVSPHDQPLSSSDYVPSPAVKGMGMGGHDDLSMDMTVYGTGVHVPQKQSAAH